MRSAASSDWPLFVAEAYRRERLVARRLRARLSLDLSPMKCPAKFSENIQQGKLIGVGGADDLKIHQTIRPDRHSVVSLPHGSLGSNSDQAHEEDHGENAGKYPDGFYELIVRHGFLNGPSQNQYGNQAIFRDKVERQRGR
jgi:hypothetical protein